MVQLVLKTLQRILFTALLFCAPARAGDQNADLKYGPLSIPTRDGKVLAADLYYAEASPQAKPVILIQTPYNKNFYRTGTIPGPGGGKTFPQDDHYNYVIVDWRGFYGSKGAEVPGYDRGLDGYDCVEWIASQPWCDGKVGTWGSSALGYIQFLTARRHPPHLLCCTPQVKDFKTQYENDYYGGDYRKEHVESLAKLGFFPAAAVLAHPTLDAYWEGVAESSDMAAEIAVPMLLVSGWFDHFPDDVLRAFEDLRTKSAPEVRGRHKLIFGPWTHSGVGSGSAGILDFPDTEGLYDTEIQFWDRYLRGIENGWEEQPVVRYYQIGENRWLTAGSWPGIPRGEVTLYLQPGGLLTEALPSTGAAPDTFRYDPADPTPALGGSRFDPFDPSVLVGPQELGPVEARSDVLVYSTPVLEEELRVNGHVSAQLVVSSDRTDTDFCVRLTDVYPDGTSVIITQGIRRMRFRDSYSNEKLMVPGEVYPVTVELQDLALTFLRGHRLRIVVCSADYPHFDKNRNDGGPMYAGSASFVAVNSVCHDAARPSKILLQTLPNAPLSAGFTWSPESPSGGVPVTFAAEASGGTPPYTCTWDLGGTVAEGESVQRSFEEGNYTIELSAADAAGAVVHVTKSLAVVPAPAVAGVSALTGPFRLRISGSGFQEGCTVEIGGQRAPETQWKNQGLVLAKGNALKAMVPKGTQVPIVVVNPDGGRSAPFPYTR